MTLSDVIIMGLPEVTKLLCYSFHADIIDNAMSMDV